MTIINEAGFYRLVLRSDKPAALEFQTWVTGDVLPSIRKHGAYVAPTATMAGVTTAAASSGNLDVAGVITATAGLVEVFAKYFPKK
jgi:prophage antirepressor-like protein